MNKTLYILLAALAVACSNDNEESFDTSTPDGMGLIQLDINVATEVESTVEATRADETTYTLPENVIPTLEDLKLEIYQVSYDDEDNPVYMLGDEYESITNYKSPYYPLGEYFVRVHNGVDITAEGATNAYFADSTTFSILKSNESVAVSLDVALQNAIICIEATDNFNKYFPGGATLYLTTESGNSITLKLPMGDDDEMETLYVQPDTNLYLSGTAIKQDNGSGSTSTATFTKSLIGVAKKSKLNRVVVDADDVAGATISVTLNNEVTQIEEYTFDLHD